MFFVQYYFRKMKWPLNTSSCFQQFQNHLFDFGQIHLADLEREIIVRMEAHLLTPKKETPDECDCLAGLLLLRYCIA